MLFKLIQTIINEHGNSAILKEGLGLLNDKIEGLEKKVVELEQENARLKQNVHAVEVHLSKQARTEEFVERRGALFKRKPGGGYHLAVYCPDCRGHMYSFENIMPYYCDRFKRSVDFTSVDIDRVMADLPK
jgi:hypothetical protein